MPILGLHRQAMAVQRAFQVCPQNSLHPLRNLWDAANPSQPKSILSLSVQSWTVFREQWPHLFRGPRTMQSFMSQDDKCGIARFRMSHQCVFAKDL